MKDLRRLVVTLVIGSFSIAAVLGIGALLSGGFDDTQARVLGTTVVIGVESTVVLCLLALVGHRWVPLALLGGAASVVATVAALVLVWGDSVWDSDGWEGLLRTFAVSAIVAGTAAQFSLLIALVLRPGREQRSLEGLLLVSGITGALVALLAIGPILAEADPGGGYWRLFGVLAILDVLGSVVLIALGGFGRARQGGGRTTVATSAPRPRTTLPAPLDIRLSDEQQRRVSSFALAHGTTPNRVLEAALDAFLPRS